MNELFQHIDAAAAIDCIGPVLAVAALAWIICSIPAAIVEAKNDNTDYE